MFKYNFDEQIDRKNTNCVKYDGLKRYFGVENIKPLWVADMDFKTPDFIINDIQKVLNHEILAYPEVNIEVKRSITSWYKKRHNIQIEEKELLLTTGVVTAISACIEAYSEINDEVIIQTPVYYPFFSCVTNNNRKLVLNPLKEEKNYYTMDFENLKKVITPKTKLLILCSPHNPVGRVWKKEELEDLISICLENNILIISDEIHSDLVFTKFHSILDIDKRIKNMCVILNSPSKTFNTAGLTASYIICKNSTLNAKLEKVLKKREVTSLNIFGLISIQSAYTKGDIWLNNLLEYLKNNIEIANIILNKNNSKITFLKPEATYLLWLNFQQVNNQHKDIFQALLHKCALALNDGSSFGENGDKYFRLNLALPKEELIQSLMKLKKEFN